MIWLRGANSFRGYLERPDLTMEVIQDDWFKTGDIGRVDAIPVLASGKLDIVACEKLAKNGAG